MHPEATHNVTLIISSDSKNSLESPGLGEDAMDSETDEIEELAGPELMQSLKCEMECEAEAVWKITLFDKVIEASCSGDNWKRVESCIQGHYTGNSECTQRWEKCHLEAKAKGDKRTCKRHTCIFACTHWHS